MENYEQLTTLLDCFNYEMSSGITINSNSDEDLSYLLFQLKYFQDNDSDYQHYLTLKDKESYILHDSFTYLEEMIELLNNKQTKS